MAVEFTNASVLGIDQSSEFLGDGIARIRSVKTISIEGFVDNRSNTDMVGVENTLEHLQDQIDSLSASSDVNTTFPLAAPGDAGSPFAITFIELFSSKVG